MIGLLYSRVWALGMVGAICFIIMYMAAYYRFLDRQCLEVTECLHFLTRKMMDLPSTDSYLEVSLLIIFMCIFANLFLGFIMDSIAESRAKKESIEATLGNRCFICDLSKTDFENAKIDFKKHIEEEHNPLAYLFYLMWALDQNEETS